MIAIVERAKKFKNRIALRSDGSIFAYQQLLDRSEVIAKNLLKGKNDLNEARVAFIVTPGFEYTAIQWGIWRAGGIAVPLCIKHPLSSIEYVIKDTSAKAIVFSSEYYDLISPLQSDNALSFIPIEDIAPVDSHELPVIDRERRAMILYTSGTTGSPKGVVTTHSNIESQIKSLITSWEWHEDDHILNTLPMHHVHGIINIMSCALWSGACCEFLPKFSESKVFEAFCRGEINIYMAVPTIYYKLIAHWNRMPAEQQGKVTKALSKFRY